MTPEAGKQKSLITKKKKTLLHTDFRHTEPMCRRFLARKKVAGSPRVKLRIAFGDKCTAKKQPAKARGG